MKQVIYTQYPPMKIDETNPYEQAKFSLNVLAVKLENIRVRVENALTAFIPNKDQRTAAINVMDDIFLQSWENYANLSVQNYLSPPLQELPNQKAQDYVADETTKS